MGRPSCCSRSLDQLTAFILAHLLSQFKSCIKSVLRRFRASWKHGHWPRFPAICRTSELSPLSLKISYSDIAYYRRLRSTILSLLRCWTFAYLLACRRLTRTLSFKQPVGSEVHLNPSCRRKRMHRSRGPMRPFKGLKRCAR